MIKQITLLLLVLNSISAWAGPSVSEGPGPVGIYADCSGSLIDGAKVTFLVRATAAPNFIDSVLVRVADNQLIDQLSCVRGKTSHNNVPTIEWSCSEYKANKRMGISVELMSGGVVGAMTGQIKQDQIYPRDPQIIGSLFCKWNRRI